MELTEAIVKLTEAVEALPDTIVKALAAYESAKEAETRRRRNNESKLETAKQRAENEAMLQIMKAQQNMYQPLNLAKAPKIPDNLDPGNWDNKWWRK